MLFIHVILSYLREEKVSKNIVPIMSIIPVCIFLFGCASRPAYKCDPSSPESTPISRFEINRAYGVAFDRDTKLTWKLCSEGQSYSHGHCAGDAIGFSWDDAMKKFDHNGDNWRLPSADELNSIVETRCKTPAINIMIFPNTTPSTYWSSSSDETNSSKAQEVSFSDGKSQSSDKAGIRNIRLVRGEDAKVLEERQELILGLIQQNRTEELIKQEKDAELEATVNCTNKAQCDRLFSLARTYIESEATEKIKVATDTIIETYEPAEVGGIGISAIKIPTKADNAEIRLSVTCKAFGSDIIIEKLDLETESAETLKSKMKKSKIACLSKQITIYRDFQSFVNEK